MQVFKIFGSAGRGRGGETNSHTPDPKGSVDLGVSTQVKGFDALDTGPLTKAFYEISFCVFCIPAVFCGQMWLGNDPQLYGPILF